jgi:diguanylate cyclase (GGDEF)-like protein
MLAIDRLSIAVQVAAAVIVVVLVAVAASIVAIGQLLTHRLEDQVGRELQGLAADMADRLDRGMYERFRDVRTVARLDAALTAGDAPEARRRAWLDELHAGFPAYAWIGFADADGVVRAATGGLLEGESVAARPWFRAGLEGIFVGDLHEALLLARLLGGGDGEPLRFVDVAAPVRDASGAVVGVVGAHLSWTWAAELRGSLLAPGARFEGTEVMILDANGRVVLGPVFGEDLSALPAVAAAREGRAATGRAAAAGFQDALVALAPTAGHRDYPGLGWIVLAATPAADALAPVRELQAALLAVGGLATLFGVGLGVVAAGRVTDPIRRLTAEAQRIGRDERAAALPRVGGAREVVELSQALRGLLRRIGVYARSLEQAELRGEEMARLAATDPLTGLMNRRAFFEAADRIASLARRHGDPTSVASIDIDRFKRINDEHGHAVGDAAIRALADACRAEARDSDLVARFGGEEFVLLLPRTSAESAALLAERLRRRIEATPVEAGGAAFRMTVSIGCASLEPGDDGVERAIDRADRALYEAKESGRNRVRVAEPAAAA